MKHLLTALILWNVITFLQFGIDKYKSVKKKWRISEKALLFCSFFMGAAGGLAGMYVFRHKTKHKKFVILMPFFLIINIAVIYVACKNKWI